MRRPNQTREPEFSPFEQPFEWLRQASRGWKLARIVLTLVGLIVLFWLSTSVYMVGPGERGVVLTFGRVTAQTEPGLQFRLPTPFQSHQLVDVARVRRAEIGFRMEGEQVSPVSEEALMLTGDENMVEVQLFVQYLVRDPVAFLFNVREPEETLHASAEVALRAAVGQNTIDFTMTEGRVQVQDQVRAQLQSLLDLYDTGLLVTEARLLVVDPPAEVREAFHDVVRAWEDRERLVKEAEGYAEQVVPSSRGEAAQMILAAEAYREQRLIRAQGNADRFLALFAEYRKAPDVTRERLYLESIERILAGTEIFVLETGGTGVLPFLPLRELAPAPIIPPAPTEAAPAPEVAPAP